MKHLGWAFSAVLFIGTAFLWNENQSLKSSLALKQKDAENTQEDSRGFKVSDKVNLRSSGRTLGNTGIGRGRPQSKKDTGAPSEGSSNDIEDIVSERVDEELTLQKEERLKEHEAFFEKMEDEVSIALDDFSLSHNWDAETQNQVADLVFKTMTDHHNVRTEILSEEVTRREGAQVLSELRRTNQEQLTEIIGEEEYHELRYMLKEARSRSHADN
jgi:hypothetical protein